MVIIGLSVSLFIMDIAQLLKRLGFKEESQSLMKEAMVVALFGFILFSMVQPKPITYNTTYALVEN